MCVVCPWAECIAVYVHISNCTVYVTLIQCCDDGGNKSYKMRNKGKSYICHDFTISNQGCKSYSFSIFTSKQHQHQNCLHVWLLLIETPQKRKKGYQIIHSHILYGKACDAASVLLKSTFVIKSSSSIYKRSFII